MFNAMKRKLIVSAVYRLLIHVENNEFELQVIYEYFECVDPLLIITAKNNTKGKWFCRVLLSCRKIIS